jgi:hypothetical protein
VELCQNTLRKYWFDSLPYQIRRYSLFTNFSSNGAFNLFAAPTNLNHSSFGNRPFGAYQIGMDFPNNLDLGQLGIPADEEDKLDSVQTESMISNNTLTSAYDFSQQGSLWGNKPTFVVIL